MPKISDDDLAKLRAKNPRGVKVFEVLAEEPPKDGGDPVVNDWVFRIIDRASYTKHKALQKRSLVGGGGGDEVTMLARELLVFPTPEDFDALRDQAPAIPEDFGNLLLRDADAGLMVREGKR